jgi:two-component system, OmpR family, KDP operon response regulator KdpE
MGPEVSHVLIVDDERSIRSVLRTILASFGFAIVEAADGEEALALLYNTPFDAVLLDISMPGMSGLQVCRVMRPGWPRMPIIMLTVQESEDAKVEALNAGADDYITKPFHVGELMARLRSAIRRSRTAHDAAGTGIIAIGELSLDPARRLVQSKGQALHLTPKQFDLLHYLMAHAGRPIPHTELLRSVWGPEYGNELEYLRTFVRQIRIKIESDPANPEHLLTDSRVGYRFRKT